MRETAPLRLGMSQVSMPNDGSWSGGLLLNGQPHWLESLRRFPATPITSYVVSPSRMRSARKRSSSHTSSWTNSRNAAADCRIASLYSSGRPRLLLYMIRNDRRGSKRNLASETSRGASRENSASVCRVAETTSMSAERPMPDDPEESGERRTLRQSDNVARAAPAIQAVSADRPVPFMPLTVLRALRRAARRCRRRAGRRRRGQAKTARTGIVRPRPVTRPPTRGLGPAGAEGNTREANFGLTARRKKLRCSRRR